MPTFILAFDHRNSLMSSFFGVRGEPSERQVRDAHKVKAVIAAGLLAAIDRELVPADGAGALVDITYGATAIDVLQAAGVRVAVPLEASGHREFTFEHADWRERLDATHPTWAKVLVRYNVEGDAAMNERQRARLLDLQQVARAIGVGFLFELLVPPEPDQRVAEYDTSVRPALVARALDELRSVGIAPDIWKIKGLDRREDCASVTARAGAPCVVLGRGADAAAVEGWLRAGAGLPCYDGFAIGRSIWWDPARAFVDGVMARDEAIAAIAQRYGHFVGVYRDAEAASR